MGVIFAYKIIGAGNCSFCLPVQPFVVFHYGFATKVKQNGFFFSRTVDSVNQSLYFQIGYFNLLGS